MSRTKIVIDTPGANVSPPPAANTGLATQAYRAILQGLCDLTVPVGVDLSQAELMRLLGLTSQPLRDALRTLASEGLVTIRARSAIRFVKADLELSRSIYQFRSLIERAGARAFAEQGEIGMIDDLIRRHREFLVHINASDLGPAEETKLASLEDDFHGALVSAMRNDLIDNAIERLRNYLTIVRRERLVTRPLAIRTLSEHIKILDACASRDADRAEAAIAAHLQQALQRILGM